MNKNYKWIIRGLALLLLPMVASCESNESKEPDPGDTDALPENTYPVELSALVNQFSTDEAVKFEFSHSDRIIVQSAKADADDNADWAAAHTGMYQVGADGKLSATTGTAFWSRKDEVRHVRGWYAAGSTSSELPNEWSVPADQTGGHSDGVLLYGSGKASYGTAHTLQMHHQTALVRVNVKFEGTASKHYRVTGVTLGNNDVVTAATFTAPAVGEAYGSWTATTAGATIRPQELTAAEGYATTVQAVMIPQSVGGKKLVNVAISNGSTLSWTPEDGETLKAGTTTRYDVTVSADLTSLIVTKIEGASWGDGSSEDAGSWLEMPDYGEVKIGDYYYSDGSWSDGGFLGFDTTGHGSVKWKSPKPAPVSVNPVTGKERNVIGIVFCVDDSRIGEGERQALAEKRIKPHGLVICAGAIETTQWDAYSNNEAAIGIPSIMGDPQVSLYTKANADISGYKVCKTILERRAGDISTLNNYKAITDARALPAPSTSTGWFIPTGGQWFDMLRNFIGMDLTDKPDFYFESNTIEENDYYHFDWQIDYNRDYINRYSENFLERVNFVFSAVPESERKLFASSEDIVTSTIANAGKVYYTVMFPKYITFRTTPKATWTNARPVLAF